MPDTSPPQAGINVLWGGGKEKVPSFNNFVSINMGGVQGISIFPGFCKAEKSRPFVRKTIHHL